MALSYNFNKGNNNGGGGGGGGRVAMPEIHYYNHRNGNGGGSHNNNRTSTSGLNATASSPLSLASQLSAIKQATDHDGFPVSDATRIAHRLIESLVYLNLYPTHLPNHLEAAGATAAVGTKKTIQKYYPHFDDVVFEGRGGSQILYYHLHRVEGVGVVNPDLTDFIRAKAAQRFSGWIGGYPVKIVSDPDRPYLGIYIVVTVKGKVGGNSNQSTPPSPSGVGVGFGSGSGSGSGSGKFADHFGSGLATSFVVTPNNSQERVNAGVELATTTYSDEETQAGVAGSIASTLNTTTIDPLPRPLKDSFFDWMDNEQDLFLFGGLEGQALEIKLSLGVGVRGLIRQPISEYENALIAGKTGSGKSAFLQMLVATGAYAELHRPGMVKFALADKRSITFHNAFFDGLPQMFGSKREVAREDDEILALLDELLQEQSRRNEAYRYAPGVQKLSDYNAIAPAEYRLPVILAVIEEAQQRAKDMGEPFVSRYSDLIRECRKYGIFVYAAGQKFPADIFTSDVVANSTTRMLLGEYNPITSTVLKMGGLKVSHTERGRGVVVSNEIAEEFQALFLPATHFNALLNTLREKSGLAPADTKPRWVGQPGPGRSPAGVGAQQLQMQLEVEEEINQGTYGAGQTAAAASVNLFRQDSDSAGRINFSANKGVEKSGKNLGKDFQDGKNVFSGDEQAGKSGKDAEKFSESLKKSGKNQDGAENFSESLEKSGKFPEDAANRENFEASGKVFQPQNQEFSVFSVSEGENELVLNPEKLVILTQMIVTNLGKRKKTEIVDTIMEMANFGNSARKRPVAAAYYDRLEALVRRQQQDAIRNHTFQFDVAASGFGLIVEKGDNPISTNSSLQAEARVRTNSPGYTGGTNSEPTFDSKEVAACVSDTSSLPISSTTPAVSNGDNSTKKGLATQHLSSHEQMSDRPIILTNTPKAANNHQAVRRTTTARPGSIEAATTSTDLAMGARSYSPVSLELNNSAGTMVANLTGLTLYIYQAMQASDPEYGFSLEELQGKLKEDYNLLIPLETIVAKLNILMGLNKIEAEYDEESTETYYYLS